MNKKTASLLLTLLAAVLLALPGRAWAADTTLTARVPSIHTLTLALDAGVRVTVDGVSYKNGARIAIPRHQSPTLTLCLPAGAVLEKADYNGRDVTRALQEGPYRLPSMESDGLLTVTLRPGTSQPATGDSGTDFYALCAALAAGALLALRRSRKKHS